MSHDNPIKRLRDAAAAVMVYQWSGDRLRRAADAVMAYQWSGDRERMDALHELCQAEIAATEALEAQAKRIAELEETLRDCVTRMDRARGILTDGQLRNWAMLDTTIARAALKEKQ
jgi:hypothetical protein